MNSSVSDIRGLLGSLREEIVECVIFSLEEGESDSLSEAREWINILEKYQEVIDLILYKI